MSWENRIVGYGEVDVDELTANPLNWRIHPKAQQDALNAILDDVGICVAVVVNRSTGFVVDGHLRVALAISEGQRTLPVTWLELTEEEEAKVLATLDAIGGLAVADVPALRNLTVDIEFSDPSLDRMIADLLSDSVGDTDSGEPAAAPDDNALTWGYATFGKVKVGCAAVEVDDLTALHRQYREENGGVDTGFVRWLIDAASKEET